MANYTKTEIERLLKEERKKSREKQKQSKFMSRTLSIYNGQKKRASEQNVVLSYSLDELRNMVKEAIGSPCIYSGEKLTINNLAVDHATPIACGGSWDISNLQIISQKSNFRKGQLTAEEFLNLQKWIDSNLSANSREDIFRRLVLGGKWSATL